MYALEINNKHIVLFQSKEQSKDSLYLRKMLGRDCTITKEYESINILDLRWAKT